MTDFQSVIFRTDWKSVIRRIAEIISGQILRGEIIERLLLFAWQLQGLSVIARPPAKATFRGIVVHESPLDCFVIDSRVILTLTSLFDDNSFATSLGRSCMKTLELPWGVAINFGRTDLQITALRNSTKTSTPTRFP